MKLSALGAALAAPLVIAAASAPDAATLQRTLLAQAQATPPLPFERTLRTVASRQEGEQAWRVRVDRYDPAKPAPQRWQLLSVDAKPPTSEAQRDYAGEAASGVVPGYHRLALLLAAPATIVPQANGGTVLRIDRLPPAFLAGNGARMADHLRAELTVASGPKGPYVSRARVYAPEPFRMMLVAKINRFEAVTSYAPDRLGRPRIVEQVMDLEGRIPGRSGTQRTVATFSELPANG